VGRITGVCHWQSALTLFLKAVACVLLLFIFFLPLFSEFGEIQMEI
jgi:hypothetical protein